jgi:hypothetical protein
VLNEVFKKEADRALEFLERKKGLNRRKRVAADYFKAGHALGPKD